MAFTITRDGDYSTPVLLGRIPKSAGLTDLHHFIWVETFIVAKENYYPLAIGSAHPDSKEDPYDYTLPSISSELFLLTEGGVGQPLYLIAERILRFVGDLCLFQREFTALPPNWSEFEHGFYTFPGQRYQTRIYEKPANLPVLIEHQYSYVLGNLENLNDYPTLNYITTVKPSGSPVESNWIEYYGRYNTEDGTYVEAESILALKTGDMVYGPWPADLNDTPYLGVKVERWNGQIFQVKHSRVKEKQ